MGSDATPDNESSVKFSLAGHGGPFLAGLVVAEACFSIRPNNAGASWACRFALQLRDDDTPLLMALRDATGCGALYPARARGGSKPQTAWVVDRMAECERLVRALDPLPLLGKKAGDYTLWRSAVAVWTCSEQTGGGLRWDRMAALSRELKRYRRYDSPAAKARVDITSEDLQGFLSGFVTGEAHFGATDAGSPRFCVNLRRDDVKLLVLLKRRLGLGRLVEIAPYGTSAPAIRWRITTVDEANRLIGVLEPYPPRGRQGSVYRAWR